MKETVTELVLILDKSGSMGGLETDTIGGFNAMLAKQKEVEGRCYLTTVLFDNGYKLLHDRIDINAISPISNKEYQVGGNTALLDAIGRTIHKIVNVQKQTDAAYRAEQVMFVIITDGQENASREFQLPQIKKMIELQQSKHKWEFVFLGANIDAVTTADQFGISASRAQNYHADHEGISLSYSAVANMVTNFREKAEFDEDWSQEVQKDFVKRGRGKR